MTFFSLLNVFLLEILLAARVEPRIAYSPEKTPPKTPETPHFGRNPFPKAYEEGLVNQVRKCIDSSI